MGLKSSGGGFGGLCGFVERVAKGFTSGFGFTFSWFTNYVFQRVLLALSLKGVLDLP